MSIVPAVYNKITQAVILKSTVLDLGWFNGDQTKFENWWREIQLFLKSNRVTGTDDRITAILVCLRGGVASIYTQKKLNKLDKETDISSWKEFVGELKTTFSDKSKVADAEWKIEMFKQGKKHIAEFMIEFKALAIKADTNKLYAIVTNFIQLVSLQLVSQFSQTQLC